MVATVYHDKEVLGTKDGCLETRKGKKKNGTGEGRGEDECCKGSSWHGLLAKFKLLCAMWLLIQYGACEVQRLKTFLCV